MRWLVYILLPFSLFAQEEYDNCENIPIQNYQVDYDVNKEYYWQISAGEISSSTNNSINIQWPDSAGTYIITVRTTRFGCVGDTSSHTINIVNCMLTQLFFPNSFTPNGDGFNEVYEIKGRSASDIEYMSIYNRWGQRIVESDENIAWDGKNCQPGIYLVNIFVKNNRYVRTVTLIR
jgi:gliding motility-associated-like protein